jgi:hypothetical protein
MTGTGWEIRPMGWLLLVLLGLLLIFIITRRVQGATNKIPERI